MITDDPYTVVGGRGSDDRVRDLHQDDAGAPLGGDHRPGRCAPSTRFGVGTSPSWDARLDVPAPCARAVVDDRQRREPRGRPAAPAGADASRRCGATRSSADGPVAGRPGRSSRSATPAGCGSPTTSLARRRQQRALRRLADDPLWPQDAARDRRAARHPGLAAVRRGERLVSCRTRARAGRAPAARARACRLGDRRRRAGCGSARPPPSAAAPAGTAAAASESRAGASPRSRVPPTGRAPPGPEAARPDPEPGVADGVGEAADERRALEGEEPAAGVDRAAPAVAEADPVELRERGEEVGGERREARLALLEIGPDRPRRSCRSRRSRPRGSGRRPSAGSSGSDWRCRRRPAGSPTRSRACGPALRGSLTST